MTDTIVIGAGIAGLSAAYRLQEAGWNVLVVEQDDGVGGVIRSEKTDGYLLEYGPNSIQTNTPLIERFVRELGLSSHRVDASAAAQIRYLVKHGRPVAAPASPTALLTSNLFGASAKFRLMKEPFVPPAPRNAEETIAEFVRRRLGGDILDYAINPFVAGVFAGDPERLSVKHTFPTLVEFERKHGSIIRGQIEKRRHPASLADTGRMFSFRAGIAELTDTLGKRLNDVRTGERVESISQSEVGWTVRTTRSHLSTRSVVCTMPLHCLGHTTMPDGFPLESLSSVTYAPLSVIYQGYRREDVRHPLDGFGLLVPEIERAFRILGTLFTSTVFPERAPAGAVLLTTFIGGMRDPELAGRSDEELHRLVDTDLATLVGIDGEPTLRRHVFWPHAIPQYVTGYDAVLHSLDEAEKQFPGLYFAGSFRGGVSVGDAARSGDEAGSRCESFLQTRPNGARR